VECSLCSFIAVFLAHPLGILLKFYKSPYYAGVMLLLTFYAGIIGASLDEAVKLLYCLIYNCKHQITVHLESSH